MRVDVQIDELMLAGFDARDRDRVADAIRDALVAHLTDRSVVQSMLRAGSRDVLRADDVLGRGLRAGVIADGVGASIAQALGGMQPMELGKGRTR